MAPSSRSPVGGDPRRLGADQLGRVGVLLLRHDARPRRELVRELAERELLARPQHDLGGEPREVKRADRSRGEVVEHEVAVRDRVDRVRRHRRRSRAPRRRRRGRAPSSAPRARPSRAAARALRRSRSRGGARRARASRSGRADGGRGTRAVRAGDGCSRASASRRGAPRARASAPSARAPARSPRRALANVQRRVGRDLVVAGAAGVELSPHRAGDLGQAGARSPCGCPRRPARSRTCPARARARRHRALEQRSSSASSSTPAERSARACARDPAMSCGARRRSNSSDELSRWNSGSGGSRNLPIVDASLGTAHQRPPRDLLAHRARFTAGSMRQFWSPARPGRSGTRWRAAWSSAATRWSPSFAMSTRRAICSPGRSSSRTAT